MTGNGTRAMSATRRGDVGKPRTTPMTMPSTTTDTEQRLHNRVDKHDWGAVAILEPGRAIDFYPVEEPTLEMLEEMEQHIATEELLENEAIARGARNMDERLAGEGIDNLLEHSMATHGRAMLITLDKACIVVGASFAQPADGEDVTDALLRLIAERTGRNQQPQWDISPIDIDGEKVSIGGFFADDPRQCRARRRAVGQDS